MKRTVTILAAIILLTGCKRKNITCEAYDADGKHIFKANNCKDNTEEKYKQEIIDKGYTNVSCTHQ